VSLRRGLEAYNKGNFPDAVEAFQKALEADPRVIEVRMALSLSWWNQYIPGAESPENSHIAHQAEIEFAKVLELDPTHLRALECLAALSFYQKRWDDAVSWNKKVIAVAPKNKEAYYTLGVIAWSRFYPKYGEARARLGLTPDSAGPLPPSAAKLKLIDEYSPVIAEGIIDLEKALEIDPEYDDAMAYMNLLVREHGDLRDTSEEWQRDVDAANEWVQKTIETKRKKAVRSKSGAAQSASQQQ